MSHDHPESPNASRRAFLKTTVAAAGAAALPFGDALAQAPAKFRRVNVSDPKLGPPVLESYKKAIRAMLALPPEDPRNWYRNVLTHTLDCPHGNWWFLPWHRAYIGWFEQTCRELSGDPAFALPYWDWTAEPRIPQAMFDDVLDPNHAAFIAKSGDFDARFKAAVAGAGYWSVKPGEDFRETRYNQLLRRSVRFLEDLWFDIFNDPRGSFFFDQPGARGLSRQNSDLDAETQVAVALKTIYPALAPQDFASFGSERSPSHHLPSVQAPLESGPHNLVHNSIGGFMSDFMSPTDPIFFLHHANLDRLWDVWTRKQRVYGRPIYPDGIQFRTTLPDDKKSAEELASPYYRWARERFLFFVDAKGRPVSKTRAGDYQDIGDFDYDYQPGSGEDAVPAAGAQPRAPMQSFGARMSNRSATATVPASGSVDLSPELVGAGERGPVLFARITLDLPPDGHARYKVVVNGPANAASVTPSSPFYAATLEPFGSHMTHGLVTFTVPIAAPVAHLRANNLLGASPRLNIRVLPVRSNKKIGPMAAHAGHDTALAVDVVSIVVQAH